MKTKIIRLGLDNFAIHKQGDNYTTTYEWDELENFLKKELSQDLVDFVIRQVERLKVGEIFFILSN